MSAARVLVGIVGLIAIVIGLFAIASPDRLVEIGRAVLTPTGLYVIGAIRVVVGVLLLLAAARSRMPRFLRVLGVIIIIAGVLTPVFGVGRARAVLEWEVSGGPVVMRLTGLAFMAIGGFIIYVVTPARRLA
jgi:hypothetical protein